jgi:hypothetical protein
VVGPDDHERPLTRRDRDSRTGFEFGYSGPTDLAICVLLDFFEVYQQASGLPVNFYGFREAFIAPVDHAAERLEIDGSAIVAWMSPSAAGRGGWRGDDATLLGHFDAGTDRGAADKRSRLWLRL